MSTLSLPDGTVHYETRGSGPPLVCVRGGWQNSRSWRPQIEGLTDEYTVVTLDLRGHGRTGATEPHRYSVALLTDDLEQLLARLGIEHPLLCGISLGGMVVQSYLDRHPSAARGAVIGGPVRSMPPVDVPTAAKPFLSPAPALSGMLSAVGPTGTFRALCRSVRATTGGPWLAVDPAVRSRAMDAAGEVPRGEWLKIFRAIYGFEPPDLSHVETPTLVLYGADEAPQVKRQGDRLARTVRSGRSREIAAAGHLLNQDNPDAFGVACTEFFAEIGAGGAASTVS